MPTQRADARDQLEEDYSGWPLRQRLELLAFDARLAEVPPCERPIL